MAAPPNLAQSVRTSLTTAAVLIAIAVIYALVVRYVGKVAPAHARPFRTPAVHHAAGAGAAGGGWRVPPNSAGHFRTRDSSEIPLALTERCRPPQLLEKLLQNPVLDAVSVRYEMKSRSESSRK
jgi:hypothetical protein